MHEIKIELLEKGEMPKGAKKDTNIFVQGWEFLDKTQKKRVLDTLMKDITIGT